VSPHKLWIQRDITTQQNVKQTKVIVNAIQFMWLPCLRRRRKVNEDSMVEFGGRIGVEDYLLAVPVALGDVSNVQNARCVTTTLDLDEIFMWSSVSL